MGHGEVGHHFAITMATLGLTWMSTAHAQRFRSPWLHDVEHLEAEPGYRGATLRWQYPHLPEPFAFRVQVCEVLPWAPRTRCRVRTLAVPSRAAQRRLNGFSKDPVHDTLRRGPKKGWYEAHIQDLRMLSNYTFAVEPDFGTSRNSLLYASPLPVGDDHLQLITSEFASVTTKGFAARAERCLANSSEVVVHTGPYFAGKIAVEEAPEGPCSVHGNPNSSLDVYTLRIDHNLCGSRLVNHSKIETNIIVHENRDIITHNTRRYLVVCSFIPDSYTITASVSLPSLNKSKNRTLAGKDLIPEPLDPNEVFTYQRFEDSHVEDSRIVAEQHSRVTQLEPGSSSHAVLMAVLVSMGLVGCGVAVWYAMRGSQSNRTASSNSLSTSYKQPLCSEQAIELSSAERMEHDCTVVSFVTIAGQPVAVLPDASASEA